MPRDPLAELAAQGEEATSRVRVEVGAVAPAETGPVGRLLAGAAEVDLTPPPGMPKAGHSRNARDGDGFRTRIRARVLHLRSGTSSLALIQCDLTAGSAIVHRLLAEAVAADTDVRLPGIFLGATHTHAGPGQFHSNDFSNRFVSNRVGFDAAYTALVVGRLAEAVRRAVAERRPARLAVGSAEVWGFTRNRSLDPHLHNTNVTDRRSTPDRKYAAVNPWLHLVRVDAEATDGGTEPLAAMVVFSIHGTGISQHDPSYNADVWAYLTGELGARIERASGRRPVVGAVEGTHGDAAPAVRPGMLVYPEAERVGRGIGEAAAELFERLEPELSGQVELAAGLREVDLRVASSFGGVTLPPAAIGTACIAGAHENHTAVVSHLPPFSAGWPKRRPRGPHGAKVVVGSRRLQPLLVPSQSFAHVMPFQVLRIGPVALVALPFEVTTEAGRRLETAVAQELGAGSGIERVVVSSLANEQFNYLTTPEEYGRQFYEGGNTIFGPDSLAFASAHAARLAGDLLGAGARAGRDPVVDDQLAERRFDLKARRFLARPHPAGTPLPNRRFAAAPTFFDPTPTEDGYWEAVWHDVTPGSLDWHEPMVAVEAADDHGEWHTAVHRGLVADDQGWHVAVVHLGADNEGGHRYAARWYGPVVGDARPHRFALLANAGRPAASTSTFP